MMEQINKKRQHLPNRLGVKGWVWGGNYKIERYLYTLHRLTGLGLLLFITIHLCVNGIRLDGETSWKDAVDVLENPAFKVGEFMVAVAFIFHALNGGRLILQHLAFTFGEPKTPIYPYVDTMRRNRWLMWVVLIATVVLAICALVASLV